MICPQNQPKHGYVIYDEHVRDAAENRLEMTLALLREAGIEADGEVMDPDPYAAVMDALGEQDYDEIIISTHPETRSGWLRQGLVDRGPARHAAPGRARGGRPRHRARRRQAHARGGQPDGRRRGSCSTCCERKAERGAAALHRDLPAVRRQRRRRETTPHERLAHTLKELEDAGLRGDRPGGPPRPVHGDPERAAVLRAGRHRHLDLPRDALGLAARRPDRPRPGVDRQAGRARREREEEPPDGIRLDRAPAHAAHDDHHGPPAANQLLARRGAVPRDAAFHHLRDHALRSVLHGLLLHPGRGGRRAGSRSTAIEPPEGDRRRQHRDPDLVELHDALGARGRPQREPPRDAGSACSPRSCSASRFLTIQINEYVHIGFAPSRQRAGARSSTA